VTEVISGLHAAERQRVAALRTEGRFFWLDVSLSETSREDLVQALGISEPTLGALQRKSDGHASRVFHVDAEAVVFSLRCYVELEREEEEEAAGYRLSPIEVHVLVTGDYLLTLHDERVSLPAALAPDLPPDRSKRSLGHAPRDPLHGPQSRPYDRGALNGEAVVGEPVDRARGFGVSRVRRDRAPRCGRRGPRLVCRGHFVPSSRWVRPASHRGGV
jgi:hypothetical protein